MGSPRAGLAFSVLKASGRHGLACTSAKQSASALSPSWQSARHKPVSLTRNSLPPRPPPSQEARGSTLPALPRNSDPPSRQRCAAQTCRTRAKRSASLLSSARQDVRRKRARTRAKHSASAVFGARRKRARTQAKHSAPMLSPSRQGVRRKRARVPTKQARPLRTPAAGARVRCPSALSRARAPAAAGRGASPGGKRRGPGRGLSEGYFVTIFWPTRIRLASGMNFWFSCCRCCQPPSTLRFFAMPDRVSPAATV